MSKVIPNEKILRFDGKPIKTAERNDDGEVVWEDEATQEPKVLDATTYDVLRELIFSLSPKGPYGSVQKSVDSFRIHQLWNQVEAGHKNGSIELKDKVYDWLHDLLKRPLPQTKEQKDTSQEQMVLAQVFWGVNWALIQNQLKIVDQRKNLAEEDLGG